MSAPLSAMLDVIEGRVPCDLCGRPWSAHTVPPNGLERLRGEEPPPPPVARFRSVPVVGMACP